MLRRLAHRPLAWIVLGVLVAGGGFGLYWFQPWKLVTSHTVNDALPSAAAPASAPAPSGAAPSAASSTTSATGNILLATGELISHEDHTTGSVKLVRLGSALGKDAIVQLLLENLDTSDGVRRTARHRPCRPDQRDHLVRPLRGLVRRGAAAPGRMTQHQPTTARPHDPPQRMI